jgi:hypothetical protein
MGALLQGSTSQHSSLAAQTQVLYHLLRTQMDALYKHTTQFETLGSLEGVGDVALAYVTYFSALGHSTHWLGSYL